MFLKIGKSGKVFTLLKAEKIWEYVIKAEKSGKCFVKNKNLERVQKLKNQENIL